MTLALTICSQQPQFFSHRSGADGVDRTFDIVYLPTDTVIAAVPYWEAAAEAKRDAQRLVRVLNAFYVAGGYIHPDQWAEVSRLINGSDAPYGSDRDPSRRSDESDRTLPPDPEAMNARRSAWAGKAIGAFRRVTGVELEDSLGDLLADLMHWSDRHNFDFEIALNRARFHYEAETSDGGDL